MSQSTPIVVVGIDVGKSGLRAHILPGGLQRHFQNDKGGRRALRNWLLKHGVSRAVFEPTARYHRRLHQGLYEAGLATGLVNPLRSRRFAESLRQLAKNDRVDAVMLARFGQFDNLASTPPKDAHLQLLSDLLTLRRKLVTQLDALRKLCSELAPEASCGPAATLTAFAADIAACDQRMLECIAADAALARRAEIIQSVPGCGPVTAACLCAELPELGTISRRQAAALLGLAPFDRDSGPVQGHRSIRGSRAHPRRVLYMAALSGIRWEHSCQACYQRLSAAGKEHKRAMLAVMRKLACLLTALVQSYIIPAVDSQVPPPTRRGFFSHCSAPAGRNLEPQWPERACRGGLAPAGSPRSFSDCSDFLPF